MKTLNLKLKTFLVIAVAFLFADSCFSQVGTATNHPNAGTALAIFHPAISGLGSNDLVTALRLPDDQIVFLNKASGEAIVKSSTNGLCLFNGRFFFADKSRLPDQVADIYVSQPFGANELSVDHAVAFEKQMDEDFNLAASPNRRHINLQAILQTEIDTTPSEVGNPLRSVNMDVEEGRLVLLFESFTRIKGKVVLDDHLNPISMAQTGKQDAK